MVGLKRRMREALKSVRTWVPERIDNRDGILSRDQLRSWKQEGVVIARKLFSPERVAEINAYIDELWKTRRNPANPFVADVFIYTPRYKRLYFRDAPDEARDYPYKLNDLFLESELIRRAALDEKLAAIIRILLGGDPMVFNSLNFEKGSQQEPHIDTLYMPPLVKNKMCAAWIALEDVHNDSGPLRYYPGSHRIPPYHFSHGKLNAIAEEMPRYRNYIDGEIEKRGIRPVEFAPQSGDVLIWHAQILHGGAPIKDPGRTRKSLVSHYFRKCDFPPYVGREIDPGRYYFQRGHPEVNP
jgi:hypothetical protein